MAVRTNLIVPVAAAEPVVAAHRARLDPTAAQGVPAHISVLVGFLDLHAIGSPELSRLEALFAAAAPIEFALAHVRRFPNVLYLAPEPAEPFVRLTESVWRAWPDHPPYGGAFEDILPHLTVAVGEERAGCLVGFASQVSIHPPRFLVGLSVNNRTYRVAATGAGVLAHCRSGQEHVRGCRVVALVLNRT